VGWEGKDSRGKKKEPLKVSIETGRKISDHKGERKEKIRNVGKRKEILSVIHVKGLRGDRL